MERRQPPADVQPHPEQRGELRVGQVGVQVACDVEERLLKDVRGVEPGPDARVDAEFDHAAEPIAVAIEKARQRLAVAGAEPIEQLRHRVGSLVHEGAHTSYLRAEAKAGPKDRRNLGMARTGT